MSAYAFVNICKNAITQVVVNILASALASCGVERELVPCLAALASLPTGNRVFGTACAASHAVRNTRSLLVNSLALAPSLRYLVVAPGASLGHGSLVAIGFQNDATSRARHDPATPGNDVTRQRYAAPVRRYSIRSAAPASQRKTSTAQTTPHQAPGVSVPPVRHVQQVGTCVLARFTMSDIHFQMLFVNLTSSCNDSNASPKNPRNDMLAGVHHAVHAAMT
ncbi:hypothetical protein BU15DRAFT_67278 [Melanogaster broomeanus]|nr:hypothetical protein BU15DRAFT_67278 [Melanogaster broomeanus]